jgi:uncharacterized protein with von Willebrand factor type A (vWA) domain
MVGDARMASSELTHRYGAIYYYERNETPGLVRLQQIAEHFSHCVWLNPEDERFWQHPTVQMIGDIFPMYQLILEGLGQAVRHLSVKK